MSSNIFRNLRGRDKGFMFLIWLVFAALLSQLVNITNVLGLTNLSYPGLGKSNSTSSDAEGRDTLDKHRRLNSTLGFEKIVYVNIPWRYDRDDAMVLQAAVSEIDVEQFPGVPADQLLEKGLGPSSNKNLRSTEKACFRSHMNVWRVVIQNNWASALIMESDAAWDTDIRDIMGYFAKGLEELLHQEDLAPANAKSTVEDPYLTEYWDVLQLSSCGASERNKNASVIYYDPHTELGSTYFGVQLEENERVVRYGFFGACTSAYAVTRKGAMKLLQKGTVDMDYPVDLSMGILAEKPNFHSFASVPDIFAQAGYHKGLGMNDRNTDNQPTGEPGDENNDAWNSVREKMSPWVIQDFYGGVRFKKLAMWDLKEYLYGPEKQ